MTVCPAHRTELRAETADFAPPPSEERTVPYFSDVCSSPVSFPAVTDALSLYGVLSATGSASVQTNEPHGTRGRRQGYDQLPALGGCTVYTRSHHKTSPAPAPGLRDSAIFDSPARPRLPGFFFRAESRSPSGGKAGLSGARVPGRPALPYPPAHRHLRHLRSKVLTPRSPQPKRPRRPLPAVMSEIKVFSTPCLDLECFLSAKAKLGQEGLLDAVLRANLEHAIHTLEGMPASKRANAALLVEGEKQLVKFTSGSPDIHYTVRRGAPGGGGAPQLQQKIHVGARLTPASVAPAHFAGHRCQDEFRPCLEQARAAVAPGGLANVELRVLCDELHLTYVTLQPSATVTRALEVKNGLERRGLMGPGLLACFQHLLVGYGQYQVENAKLVLQSEGQIVELVSGRPDDHNVQFYIFADANNQIQSQRVQDIDLWDYD
ncbi:hypothetical protein COCON_G00018480 [Conger conger]|uniref:Uncharacterized protein n=1 Tax=Conger conger TaxID=82655 RepID=A0A9Q1E406_CONCO|nr:hypothetical protein COCON_G00018480 [Conger conger]